MFIHPTGTYVYFDFFRYNNHTLPSPRAVSVSVLIFARSRSPRYDPLFTHMIMQWGQFLDHDLDFTTMAPSIQQLSDGLACKETCDYDAPCFPITGKLCVRNLYVDFCIALLLDIKSKKVFCCFSTLVISFEHFPNLLCYFKICENKLSIYRYLSFCPFVCPPNFKT